MLNKIKEFEDLNSCTHKELKSQYTFDSYIVDKSNMLAYRLSLEVLRKKNKYNPLFICSKDGLGKTHLLQAIKNEAINLGLNIIYTTGKQFQSEFVNSLKNKEYENFIHKYKKCDILLIDDIQFISYKEETQEEFLHIYKEFLDNEKQIIMTCDKPLSQIGGLSENLKSRLQWGIVVKLEVLEFETKITTIETQSKFYNLKLTGDIINYIAENTKNFREIECYIKTISRIVNLIEKEITLKTVKNIFSTK